MGDGSLEMEKIIHCLRRNGYKLTGVDESDEYRNFGVATFEKEVEFSDAQGSTINDTPIIVNIIFDPRMDYTHLYEDEEEGDFEFDKKMVTQFVLRILKRSPSTSNRKSTTRKSRSGSKSDSSKSGSGNSGISSLTNSSGSKNRSRHRSRHRSKH